MQINQMQEFIQQYNYCHVSNYFQLITYSKSEEQEFKKYWDNLVLDQNFIKYTQRERRILRYFLLDNKLILNLDSTFIPNKTYAIDYVSGKNCLTYVEESFINNNILQSILKTDLVIIDKMLKNDIQYEINIHLFRIKAQAGIVSPTTSGIHQDGVDWVFMHFINANNNYPVISKLYKENMQVSSAFFEKPLSQFLETIIVNDTLFFHSASAVQQIDTNIEAFRDLLVITIQQIR